MNGGRYRYYFNPFFEVSPVSHGEAFRLDSPTDVRRFHESLSEYNPTPVLKFDQLAANLGIGSILIKDESQRFGLNSFKALGACYAMHRLFQAGMMERRIVSAATEGNHGRAVAWMARKMGLEAVIYVPSNASPVRLDAIRREGARVVTVEGSYEDTVLHMAKESAEKQFTIVSDTGYEGYTEIPKLITAGYFTLFLELQEQLEASGFPIPDYLFLQGGVGTFASSGIAYFDTFASRAQSPTIVTVEPLEADCLLASAASPEGSLQHSSGNLRTRMSGLNCGFPSIVAWPIVRSGASLLMAVNDELATTAVEHLKHPTQPDPAVQTSESGAAGLAALFACCEDSSEEVRESLGFGTDTTVLLVNTEGPLVGLQGE